MDGVVLAETDWWNVVSAVGTAAATLITAVGILYNLYRGRRTRPKLLVDFHSDKDVREQKGVCWEDRYDPDQLSMWLRIKVTNAEGRKVAHNCRAFIMGVEKVGKLAQQEDVNPNDVRELTWTHDMSGGGPSRDLVPGVPHWVDVAATFEGRGVLQVNSKPVWPLPEPGEYIFSVRVSAGDSDYKDIKVRVHWNGEWKSLAGRRV